MPGYKATVIGENFDFVVDDEPQLLEFSRTMYIDAADVAAAEALAMAMVREELLAQSILDDDSDQLISVEEIDLVDVNPELMQQGEFIWTFAEEAEFDEAV